MTSLLSAALEPGAGIAAMADLALKGTLVLAAAGIATLALRRAPASARHLAWTLCFAGMLALPVLAVALPAWRVPLLPAQSSAAAVQAYPMFNPATETNPVAPIVREVESAAPADARSREASAPGARTEVLRGSAPGWDGAWLMAWAAVLAWLAGVALAAMRLGMSIVRVRREGRRARPIDAGAAAEMRDRLVWRMGIDRPVVLLEGEADAMPLTWGIARPRVLLPAGTEAWPDDRLRTVLTHELAHVRRRDCLWQLLAEAACALHWFNPLAWAAARRLRLESEHACDDQVLLAGSRGADYASHLLDVARSLRPPRPAVLAGVPMARPSQLRTRLHAVLSADRARGGVPLRIAAPALAGATCLVALIAALTPARAGAAETAVAPWRCSAQAVGSHVTDLTDGHAWDVSWSNGSGCGGQARIEGDVRFTADFTDVASIRPGGRLRVEMHDGARRTSVEVRPRENGLSRVFRTGGERVQWGPEAERWLAAVLPELLRHTSYDAERRASALLRQGGPAAVADEIARIPGEALRAEYLAALVGGDADARAVSTALRVVGEMESDDARVDLLLRAAPRLPADAYVHRAYLRAAGAVRGDADVRRVLAAVAPRGLERGEWLELFRIATQVDGGRELQRLLNELAPSLPADARVAAAFADAAARLPEDAARRAMDAYARAAGAPADRPGSDTIPADRVDRPDATTTLVHEDRTDEGVETELILLAKGVTLAPDRTRFTLSRDGFVIFRENRADGRTRRVEIRPGTGDGFRYTWNGDFSDADREAWMRGMLAHFAGSTRPLLRW